MEASALNGFVYACESLKQMLDAAMGLNYCLDCRGLIGLDRQAARDSVALAEHLEEREKKK